MVNEELEDKRSEAPQVSGINSAERSLSSLPDGR